MRDASPRVPVSFFLLLFGGYKIFSLFSDFDCSFFSNSLFQSFFVSPSLINLAAVDSLSSVFPFRFAVEMNFPLYFVAGWLFFASPFF